VENGSVAENPVSCNPVSCPNAMVGAHVSRIHIVFLLERFYTFETPSRILQRQVVL
jgi:hypothetical protein